MPFAPCRPTRVVNPWFAERPKNTCFVFATAWADHYQEVVMYAGLAPRLHLIRGSQLPRPVGAELADGRPPERLPLRVSILLWVALATAGWAVIGLVVLALLGRL